MATILIPVDREIATKMLRTVSREGQHEVTNPPLRKKRSSGRVQSARLSEERLVKGMYRDISKFVINLEAPIKVFLHLPCMEY